ncbi:uncharacterized protein LOC132714861 [Ruditapes philippinarum]|uniref:uncharacterized protein LOC132714861 n=1 Tax=Ruditapes philippinarum TaxID=129788 RepID=UPI00295B5C00|nr:uncharacterized protein LOC132714861 [Ruditapes philippinarum]
MKIIKTPLTIAANELLAAVDYSISWTLMILKKKRWKICYCIVSQGCLYLYDDWLSREAFLKKSLKEFERVWESTEEYHGAICFYLGFNDENTPLHFCCDTEKAQKEWVDKLDHSILEVKTHVRPPCDSGYGSAGTVPAIEIDVDKETRIGSDDKAYDEVDQRRFGNINHGMKEEADVKHMKGQHVLDSADTDDDYEDVSCSLKGLSAGDRKHSIASSYCSVSAPSDSHCDMHLVHENDKEKKTAHSHKSERSKTETERHNETTPKQNGALLFPKAPFIDELKTRVHSDNKGLSGGGRKKDMQPS